MGCINSTAESDGAAIEVRDNLINLVPLINYHGEMRRLVILILDHACRD